MVQVVSMEEVTMRFGEGAFQEKEVNGAGEVVFLDCRRRIFCQNSCQKARKLGLPLLTCAKTLFSLSP